MRQQSDYHYGDPTEYQKAEAEKIRAMLSAPRGPSRAWAPRVLERAAAGEPICYRAIELAREVVGMEPEREPGSDDER
jgi:hypothetical protein